MPFQYQNGKNPYRHTYFQRLGLGPDQLPPAISQRAKSLQQKVRSLHGLERNGERLDEHAISEASSKLLHEPPALAEELLLSHSLPRDKPVKLDKVLEEIRDRARLPEEVARLLPRHPGGIFWFLPEPGEAVAEPPPWESFGLVAAGDEADRLLDIIFDH